MQSMGQSENFSYWKRPWHKWIVLAAAISQLLCLWMNAQEYRNLSEVGIFSASEWESYATQQSLQCAFNGLAAAVFIGIFLIGIWTRNQRTARLTEGLLLLFLALAWGVAGFVLQLTSSGGNKIVWTFILLLALGGGVSSLWRNRSR